VAALLLVGLVFGGASREAPLRLLLVELASLPVLAWALWRWSEASLAREQRLSLILLAAIIALPVIQIIPLPPSVWTQLPGRELQTQTLAVAGLQPGWAPISIKPAETLRCILALIPPVAIFLAVTLLDPRSRARLALVVAILAVASALLGALQVALPDADSLRLYARIHEGLPIGFFANRNHQATLMCAAVPLVMAYVFGGSRVPGPPQPHRIAIGLVLVGLMVVVAVATRSRAGTVVMGLTLLLSLGVFLREIGPGRRRSIGLIAGGAAAALAAVVLVASSPILQRFDQNRVAEDQRFAVWPNIAEAAQKLTPIGAGFGSFDTVYRAQERLDTMRSGFMNHAHNDYLELWLEGGWPGILIFLALLVWAGWRGWSAWRDKTPDPISRQGRAACLVLVAVAAHSVVDYPLRTPAMAMVVALACAMLIPPPTPKARQA
jgi:O-antigen ligase